MVSAARKGLSGRLPILILAIVLLAAGALALFHAPAFAQERPWSLRNLLFPRRERIEPPSDVFPAKPKVKKRSAPRKPAEPEVPVVEKTPDARVVLVVGDFMASGLAEGLETVFAQNASIRIVLRSNGSSGFVRDDFYNWPAEIRTVIETEKPAVVVAMLGSNDRQQMKVGDTREPPRSPNWDKEYEARTEAFAKAAAGAKVPFLWVGMPSFKVSKMTTDMLAFNGLYEKAAESVGGEFVDVWDGFVDENGAFVTMGPDINGQPVRLRADDGINMAKAGKRKLAFYTEKPLLKILGLPNPDGAAVALAPAGLRPETPGQSEAALPANLDRTPPMLLNDPALDGGTELLGAAPPAKPDLRLPGAKLAVEGIAPDASPGRADDFSWPPRLVPPTTAATGDTTTAIQR